MRDGIHPTSSSRSSSTSDEGKGREGKGGKTKQNKQTERTACDESCSDLKLNPSPSRRPASFRRAPGIFEAATRLVAKIQCR